MRFILTILILGAVGYFGWKYYEKNFPTAVAPVTMTDGPGTMLPTTTDPNFAPKPVTIPSATTPDTTVSPAPTTTPDTISTSIGEINNSRIQIAFTAIGGGKIYSGSIPTVNSDLVVNDDGSIGGMASAQLTTLTTDSKVLTAYLKSAKGLNVYKYPTATFVITSWKPSTKVSETFDITGRLTLRGVTKTVKTTATFGKLTRQYNISMEIDPKEFGTNMTIITEPILFTIVVPMK